MNTRVSRFLFNYRTAVHSTTHTSPAELMFGRQLRTPLDVIRPDLGETVRSEQSKQKQYKDQGCRRGDIDTLRVGDPVYVSAVGQLRGSHGKNWLRGVLLKRDGVKLTVRLSDGRVLVRHVDRVRACHLPLEDQGRGCDPDPVDLTSPPAAGVPAGAAAGAVPGPLAGPVSPVLGAAGDRSVPVPPAAGEPSVSDRVLRPRPLREPDRLRYV